MSEQEIVQALTEAGYTEHRVPRPILNADRFFQRRVGLDGHAFYFINIGLYDRQRHGDFHGDRYALQLDSMLYHPQWESGIEVTLALPASRKGIAAAEAMVAMLHGFGFEPDRDNNDDLDGARRALAATREGEARG